MKYFRAQLGQAAVAYSLLGLKPEVFEAAQAYRNATANEQTLEVVRIIEREAFKTGAHFALNSDLVKGLVEALEGVVRDGQYSAHATKRYLEVDRPKQNVIKTNTPMRIAAKRASEALSAFESAIKEMEG